MNTLIILIAAIVSYALAGLMKGIMDTLQFHYAKSIFPKGSQFWNPAVSWRNKYKNGDVDQGPKFPGSTTVFVSLTDGWHLVQMFALALQRLSIILAAAPFIEFSTDLWVNIAAWAAVFVGLIIVHSAGFHLTYSVLLVRKPKE